MFKFSSLVYVYFMMTSIGADASHNDLEFFKLLHKYRQIDSEVADITIGAMKRHLFYLTEENVVMSLFSNRLSEDEKSRMAVQSLRVSKLRSQSPQLWMRVQAWYP